MLTHNLVVKIKQIQVVTQKIIVLPSLPNQLKIKIDLFTSNIILNNMK